MKEDIKYVDIELSEITVGKSKGKEYDLSVGDSNVITTPRFWRSIGQKFRFNRDMFRYFTPAEVLNRVSDSNEGKTKLRVCIDAPEKGTAKALGVSSPDKTVLQYDDLKEFYEEQGAEDLRYNDGIIKGVFTPSGGDNSFKIGNDEFEHRYDLRIPIDGFGLPKTTLSLLREVCSNGMTALSPAFTNILKVGDQDPMHGLVRAIESYKNDDGFSALENKMQSSQNALASVAEVQYVFRKLMTTECGSKVIKEFNMLTGNLEIMYGLTNVDSIGQKKLKLLPSNCTVYDLLNFVTELSTHHAKVGEKEILQTVAGTLLSQDYDLEDTADTKEDFQDLFLAA